MDHVITSLTAIDYVLILVFILGYFFITIEHITHVNKATVALLMSVILWALVYAFGTGPADKTHAEFIEHVSNSAQVVLFLLGALGIVEVISAHHGFDVITKFVHMKNPYGLFWLLGLITFFLSAALDNLTTTIVMVSLASKIVKNREQLLLIGSGIVIAANSGGAWSPIGDVTTTMLWIGGNVTTIPTMRDLFLPSLVCMIVSFACLHFLLPKDTITEELQNKVHKGSFKYGTYIFLLGLATLIFVPILRYFTGLPPFMGVMFGLGIMWLVTDILHRNDEKYVHLRMPAALSRTDLSSCLFFLGILLAIQALESEGVLASLANFLNTHIGHPNFIAVAIGVISAIVDNVPLVAGSMGMYSLADYPPDSSFWQLVAYCAGTGGSMLIIGSAAGVAFMGMEKATFTWYLKKVTLPAALGYFAGVAAYFLLFGF